MAPLNAFAFGATLFGWLFLLPQYYQRARGQDAISSALSIAPQGVGTVLSLLVIGRLIDRMGPKRLVLAGSLLTLIGTLSYTQLDTARTGLLMFSHLLRGAGFGAMTAPIIAAVYRAVSREKVPAAATSLNVLVQLGGSIGTAVFTVVLQSNLAEGGQVANAFSATFWVVLLGSATGIVLALFMPGRVPTAQPTSSAPESEEHLVHVLERAPESPADCQVDTQPRRDLRCGGFPCLAVRTSQQHETTAEQCRGGRLRTVLTEQGHERRSRPRPSDGLGGILKQLTLIIGLTHHRAFGIAIAEDLGHHVDLLGYVVVC